VNKTVSTERPGAKLVETIKNKIVSLFGLRSASQNSKPGKLTATLKT